VVAGPILLDGSEFILDTSDDPGVPRLDVEQLAAAVRHVSILVVHVETCLRSSEAGPSGSPHPTPVLSRWSDFVGPDQILGELVRTTRRLSELQRIAKVGDWSWNADTGVKEWSEQVYRIYGVDPRRRPPSSSEAMVFYHPDDRPVLSGAVEAAISRGTPFDLVLRRIWPEGETTYVKVSSESRLHPDGSVRQLYGTVQDITESVLRQEALRKSEQRYRNLYCSMNDGVCLCEMVYAGDGRAVDYCFLEANPSFEAMTGITSQALAGKRASEVHSLEHLGALAAVVKTGISRDFTMHFKPGDRQFRVTAQSPGPGRFALIAQDITEQKRAEAALVKAERDYRTIFERAAHGIFQSSREGRLLRVNPAMVQMFGYASSESMTGEISHVGAMLYHDPVDRQTVTFLLNRDGVIRHHRARMRRRDDVRFWVNINAHLVEEGGETSIHGFMEDITGLVQAREEAEMRRQQLIQADKMVSLGVLAAGVAHEINNPNNFIMLNAPILAGIWQDILPILDEATRREGEFTLQGVPYSEMRDQVPQLIGGMLDGAGRIAQIVRGMKDFSRQGRPELDQEVDLDGVIDFSVNLLAAKLKKTAGVRVIRDGSLPRLRGNAQQLEQVVINLLINAVEATTNCVLPIELETRYRAGIGRVLLQVRDHGNGIDGASLSRITDPFFTTKRESGGLGLGLSVSSAIVKAHAGELRFAPTPGGGTTAIVELPCMPGTNGDARDGTE
jgi:PAS domain S-box-containing protein